MNKSILRIFISSCALALAMPLSSAQPNSTEHPSPATAIAPSPKEVAHSDLLIYLDGILNEAGFSNTSREYLTNIAKEQLLTTKSADYEADKRTLKRNLYMFFKSLAEKNPEASDAVQKIYFLANQTEEPWNVVLSKDGLASLKANHAFDNLTVDEIKNIYAKFCPFWPFCKK